MNVKNVRKLEADDIHLLRSNVLLRNPEIGTLGNILERLLSNSLRSRPQQLKLSIKLYQNDNIKQIMIIDDGSGIPWMALDAINTDEHFKGRFLNSLTRLSKSFMIISRYKKANSAFLKKFREGAEEDSIKRVREFPFRSGTFMSITLSQEEEKQSIAASFSQDIVLRTLFQNSLTSNANITLKLENSRDLMITGNEYKIDFHTMRLDKDKKMKVEKYKKKMRLSVNSLSSTCHSLHICFAYNPDQTAFQDLIVSCAVNSFPVKVGFLNRFIKDFLVNANCDVITEEVLQHPFPREFQFDTSNVPDWIKESLRSAQFPVCFLSIKITSEKIHEEMKLVHKLEEFSRLFDNRADEIKNLFQGSKNTESYKPLLIQDRAIIDLFYYITKGMKTIILNVFKNHPNFDPEVAEEWYGVIIKNFQKEKHKKRTKPCTYKRPVKEFEKSMYTVSAYMTDNEMHDMFSDSKIRLSDSRPQKVRKENIGARRQPDLLQKPKGILKDSHNIRKSKDRCKTVTFKKKNCDFSEIGENLKETIRKIHLKNPHKRRSSSAKKPTVSNPKGLRYLNKYSENFQRRQANLMKPKVKLLSQTLKFQKTDIQNMKIVGQVDNKFIVCRMNKDTLIALDQHAAHERVRLEYLSAIVLKLQFPDREIYSEILQNYLNIISNVLSIESGCSEHHKQFERMEEESKLHKKTQFFKPDHSLKPINHKMVIEQLGKVKVENLENIVKEMADFMYEIFGITAVLKEISKPEDVGRAGGCVRLEFEVISFASLLGTTLVQESLEIISGVLRNHFSCNQKSSLFITDCLSKVLYSKACRYAIKFNDSLCRCQIQGLLDCLSLCKDPFHCAHGRPTLYPICNILEVST
ncbi:unnamed protein product [Moneuplotes crassus]|uniref:MutL C-terminal dimerisation domain-containing protein n=1 Tax=Euplotes crassus TaxID=5936 RepID=A0AAD1Y1S7_EUPCR|nr:unnamed protein product [Moneuplotes crassus]